MFNPSAILLDTNEKDQQNKTKHPSFLLVGSQDENLTISSQFVSSLGIPSNPAQMNYV